jgi:hypothetical protein
VSVLDLEKWTQEFRQIYDGPFIIFGGAVRDAVLGLEPKDIDICIYNMPNEKWLFQHDLEFAPEKYGEAINIGRIGKFDISYSRSITRKINNDFTCNSMVYQDGRIHGIEDLYETVSTGLLKPVREIPDTDKMRARILDLEKRFGWKMSPPRTIFSGWRYLKWSNDDHFVGFFGAKWDSPVFEAQCVRGKTLSFKNCGCGIYHLDDKPGFAQDLILTRNVGWGDIVEHQRGFRSQYSRIEEAEVSSHMPYKVVKRLQDWGIKVTIND